MDNVTRWSIAMGAGVLAGCLLLGSFSAATSATRSEVNDIVRSATENSPETLSPVVEYASFDADDVAEFAARLLDKQDGGNLYTNGCGNSPASLCKVRIRANDFLERTYTEVPIARKNRAVVVNHYKAKDSALLDQAKDVTDYVNYEEVRLSSSAAGFLVTTIQDVKVPASSQGWQFALAAIPAWAPFVLSAALGTLITVLTAWTMRPRREDIEVLTPSVNPDDPLAVFAPLLTV